MEQSIKTPQWDKLKELMNVEDHPNKVSSELVHREEYQKYLEIIGLTNPDTNKQQWFCVLGKRRITEVHESKQDLLFWIENHYWGFQICIISAIVDETFEIKESEQRKSLFEHFKQVMETPEPQKTENTNSIQTTH